MRRPFCAFLPLGAALLLLGCASGSVEQRLESLETAQTEDRQVMDLRLGRVEERLVAMEHGLGEIRADLTDSAKEKQRGRKSVRGKPAPLPSVARTAPSAPPPPASAPAASPAPVAQAPQPPSTPEPAVPLGVPASPRSEDAAPAPGLAPMVLADKTTAAEPAKPAPEAPKAAPEAPEAPRAAAPAAGVAPPEASGSSAQKRVSPAQNATVAYEAALAQYYKGQYAKAQETFADFLRLHPGSSLAPNALYWQGECLYSLGKFDAAILAFKDVASKYPKHDKAAAALLKAGFAYAELKDKENARFYWQILLDDFPGSAPAALARKRMATL